MKGSYHSTAHNSVIALKCRLKHTHCKKASHHGRCTYTAYIPQYILKPFVKTSKFKTTLWVINVRINNIYFANCFK